MKTEDLFQKALKYLDDKNIPSLVDKGYIARWMVDFASQPSDVNDSDIEKAFNKAMKSNYFENGLWYDLSLSWKKDPNILVSIMKAIYSEGAKDLRDGQIKPTIKLK